MDRDVFLFMWLGDDRAAAAVLQAVAATACNPAARLLRCLPPRDATLEGRLMQQWMNLMEVNCDPAREEEFRAWFRDVHMTDVLTTPGFVGARQHETKEFRDGRGKYLHLYNIVSDDIERTMTLRRDSREEERKRGRYRAGLTMHVWRDVLWRQVSERVAPSYARSELPRWLNLVEVNV